MKKLKDLKNMKPKTLLGYAAKQIKNCKFLDNDLRWAILNFSFSLLILVISISIIIANESLKNVNLLSILVYAVYLPLALTHIFFSGLLSLITVKNDLNDFYKKWYFYLPIATIFIEAVVLPIPLNFSTRNISNTGVLWSIIIFAFAIVILTIIHFLKIYKLTLNDSYDVLNSDEVYTASSEKEDVKQEINNEPIKADIEPIKADIIKENNDIENTETNDNKYEIVNEPIKVDVTNDDNDSNNIVEKDESKWY